MLYLILLAISLILYWKNRLYSVLIVIILSLSGMKVLPSIIGNIKATDMAIVFILFITIFHLLKRTKTYFALDPLGKRLCLLLCFFLLAIPFSVFYYNISWEQTLIVARTYVYFLAYFILRQLSYNELLKLFKYLASITFASCILYILQIPLDTILLFGYDSDLSLADNSDYGGISRFTNIPNLRNLFFFTSFFCLLNVGYGKAKWKKIVYPLSVFLSFGRTAIMLSVAVFIFGVIQKKREYLKWVLAFCIIFAPLLMIVRDSFEKRDSSSDIEGLIRGDYKQYQTGYKSESTTLLYRVAWLYERVDYLKDRSWLEICFGLGLISDKDRDCLRMYSFRVRGYGGEDNFQILYSYDIGWGNLVTRFGLLGSICMLSIWIYLGRYFWRKRDDGLMFASFLYWLFIVLETISSQGISETRAMIPFFILYFLSRKGEGKRALSICNYRKLVS